MTHRFRFILSPRLLFFLSGLLVPNLARAEVVVVQPPMLFDFTRATSTAPWVTEDDGVMGGRSRGGLQLVPGHHAVFRGQVSLENDGGFSSVQADFPPVEVSGFSVAKLRIRGDGRNYRFIVESDPRERVYYVHEFATGDQWETVTIPLRSMKPMRRGNLLKRPDYPGQTLSQVRLMIANGREESFRLEIAKIWLE